MKIYIVQVITGGVADCPKVFEVEAEADTHFLASCL